MYKLPLSTFLPVGVQCLYLTFKDFGWILYQHRKEIKMNVKNKGNKFNVQCLGDETMTGASGIQTLIRKDAETDNVVILICPKRNVDMPKEPVKTGSSKLVRKEVRHEQPNITSMYEPPVRRKSFGNLNLEMADGILTDVPKNVASDESDEEEIVEIMDIVDIKGETLISAVVSKSSTSSAPSTIDISNVEEILPDNHNDLANGDRFFQVKSTSFDNADNIHKREKIEDKQTEITTLKCDSIGVESTNGQNAFQSQQTSPGLVVSNTISNVTVSSCEVIRKTVLDTAKIGKSEPDDDVFFDAFSGLENSEQNTKKLSISVNEQPTHINETIPPTIEQELESDLTNGTRPKTKTCEIEKEVIFEQESNGIRLISNSESECSDNEQNDEEKLALKLLKSMRKSTSNGTKEPTIDATKNTDMMENNKASAFRERASSSKTSVSSDNTDDNNRDKCLSEKLQRKMAGDIRKITFISPAASNANNQFTPLAKPKTRTKSLNAMDTFFKEAKTEETSKNSKPKGSASLTNSENDKGNTKSVNLTSSKELNDSAVQINPKSDKKNVFKRKVLSPPKLSFGKKGNNTN